MSGGLAAHQTVPLSKVLVSRTIMAQSAIQLSIEFPSDTGLSSNSTTISSKMSLFFFEFTVPQKKYGPITPALRIPAHNVTPITLTPFALLGGGSLQTSTGDQNRLRVGMVEVQTCKASYAGPYDLHYYRKCLIFLMKLLRISSENLQRFVQRGVSFLQTNAWSW